MFFKSLFDLKFEKFVTRQVASVMYGILVGVLGIATLIGMLWSLYMAFQPSTFYYYSSMGTVLYLLLALVVIPIVSFLYLIILRVAFESSIALVMIAENTKRQDN